MNNVEQKRYYGVGKYALTSSTGPNHMMHKLLTPGIKTAEFRDNYHASISIPTNSII